jgi:UDP-2,4-diacetamido-2,4,6-trideoxy-beta-L-altropyranose hydrolase
MKNVGLIFDSNQNIGEGHFWRCFNLAKILKKKGTNFFFISNKLQKKFIKILNKENFDYIQVSSLKKISIIKNLIKKIKLDIFISDYYDLSEKNKKEIKKNINCFVVIDDHINKKHFCHIYINNNFMSGEVKNKIKKLNPKSILLLGNKYFIRNYEFFKSKIKKIYKKKIKKIYVFFGSSDKSNETFKFIKSIEDLKNLQFDILIGKLNKNYKQIKYYCKNQKNIKIFYNLTNYKTLKLMQKNDLYFGAGGVNLSESLFLGLPSIAICTADNQKEALKMLHKKKVVHYLGKSNHVNNLLIKNCIKKLLYNHKTIRLLLKKTHHYYNNNDLNILSKKLHIGQ